MNEQDSPITDEKRDQPPELPPIPDGGLTKGLPSWLAAPPTRPSKLAGDATPLDLQALAGSAQLPQWLDDLSERVDRDGRGMPIQGDVANRESPEDIQAALVNESHAEDAPALVAAIVPAAVTDKADPVVAPSEPKQEIIIPEAGPLSTYLLYVLAVVVVVALAAWLIWG